MRHPLVGNVGARVEEGVVTNVEVGGKVLAPPSMREACFWRDAGGWGLTITAAWESDLCDTVRREGALDADVRFETPQGGYLGHASIQLGEEVAPNSVEVLIAGIGELR